MAIVGEPTAMAKARCLTTMTAKTMTAAVPPGPCSDIGSRSLACLASLGVGVAMERTPMRYEQSLRRHRKRDVSGSGRNV